ncbi:hypothetical protein [Chitinophaga terrae (ex Kim and Jung 2007)]|uniref:hypothetical protein n=1 Tax=Chitinophaga terrae (ex Kim and Jung 2007) TaxID=408074 RepID=UPI000B7DD90C|nr:hypothetical protein [Chitinophaga terrae (ex Kim and Jung 2007)]MDQ0106088.1 hypothetical protein [Chitinophaga terrae (ex Kim and Jung 2007)]
MQEILSAPSATFGEKIARGWQLAAVNPRLFNYYWQDMQKMQEFVQYYNNEYVPDAESFFSVRRSWYAVSMPRQQKFRLL